jgi:hypothetical protein
MDQHKAVLEKEENAGAVPPSGIDFAMEERKSRMLSWVFAWFVG